ncbi:MAG: bifunctional (p)ppGpp synthetase/guanosine-3',5'-bis(diphosphate) 3'-pyrophosphohydrolase [Pseudomonadota bacterium]
MIRINDIIDRMSEYLPADELDLIDRAYIYSARVHDGQVRLSGEPYLSHPLEVAGILADMNLDVVSVAAGLLHDVIEDTHATAEEISQIFGHEVAHIVSGVTKLSALTFNSSQARQAESIRKMLLAMADDIRVIMIKLADRLHNMRTLQFHRAGRQRAIAQETLDIYAPIASRLGIYWIKKELEDASFRYLQPEEYAQLVALVSTDRTEREAYVDSVQRLITAKMAGAGLTCEVMGRYKHFHSIYQKMITQDLPFEEIYDIIAFRIILDSIPHCYEALGLIHSLWKPIDIKFKDYIARPKSNMYQSLHTTVIGPKGERVEVQIRTQEMDRVAKSGIAAHWSYKEGRQLDERMRETFAWIQNMVENQELVKNPGEFLENMRLDLFPDEVYVFTPNGEVKTLPKGATPVDFAYMIHSEVGHQCSGAKVNGRLVPLLNELQTGDIVEVITSKNHNPSKDWLNFVKTVKARSRIRQWIKTQEKERSLSLGREMCDKAFRKHRFNFGALLKTDEMAAAVDHFGFKGLDDLIVAVGYGKITPLQIIRRFEPKSVPEDTSGSLLNKIISTVRKKKDQLGVVVKGIDDVLVRFAKCCQPVPGDDITGYITRGQGVTVHRNSCINALKMNPERQIDVEWSTQGKDSFPVRIRVTSLDRVGLLADIVASISKNTANIQSAQTETRSDGTVDSYFSIGVENKEHLGRILTAIKKVRMVQGVRRLR